MVTKNQRHVIHHHRTPPSPLQTISEVSEDHREMSHNSLPVDPLRDMRDEEEGDGRMAGRALPPAQTPPPKPDSSPPPLNLPFRQMWLRR